MARYDREKERLRKQAYRERQKQASAPLLEDLPVEDGLIRAGDMIDTRDQALVDDQLARKAKYLADAETGARLVSISRHETPEQQRARVERAMRYAEWRWDGFHAGEIASL